jgi:gamma-glutamyltranspeptidase/glutathione hydrolase
MIKATLLVALLLVFILTAAMAGDRYTPKAYRSGRSVLMATHGIVATSHPLAAQIGLDILKQGGNAVDAAIATSAAMGLMEPMSCGIGGDLYAIVWDAKTNKLYGLNASGRSPYRASLALFAEKGLKEIPLTGSLSWSVPGCVDGWEELRMRFGRMKTAQLLEPSIRYAVEGFPVTEVIAGYWKRAERKLRQYPDAAKTYLFQDRAPAAGQIFKNPNLARSYREIAAHGRDGFYKGAIAQEIVSFSEKNGGLFTLKDFTDHSSTWVEPLSTSYRGFEIWELPPPGQGIAVLQMLNILEGYDVSKMGPQSADYWHLLVEAKKLAYADRARFYADPAFVQVPMLELIAKPYAERRRKLVDPRRAMTQVDAGDPKLGQSETIYLCVVDKDRNCVSLIQSNYVGFGSGLVPGDLGFALQNRGTLFALDAAHANRLEPHKRPFHTIIPSFVTKGGKPWLVFGVMGGDMQPQGQVEVLCNLIDFGMNVQEAGEAPRIEHLGLATPTGRTAKDDGGALAAELGIPKAVLQDLLQRGGIVAAERGIPEAVLQDLLQRGHHVKRVRKNGGGYQGILLDPNTNVLHGGSEPRKDGCALGY